MKIFCHLKYSLIGKVFVGEEDGAITDLHFERSRDFDAQRAVFGSTPLLAEAERQLEGYFAGTRRTFCLPLAPRGTDFQMRCWEALRAIPYGSTESYGDIARKVGSPKACRAVGMANNRNPIAIIIPCHRVIGSDGSLVGFGGGLEIKRALLALEAGAVFSDEFKPAP
ncbi:MAG: methylated-DNA--[protein]-cysteine S-methyltransferase [Cloacibacillus sp.]